jgi:hypothetical protein
VTLKSPTSVFVYDFEFILSDPGGGGGGGVGGGDDDDDDGSGDPILLVGTCSGKCTLFHGYVDGCKSKNINGINNNVLQWTT